jgi:hypothetical protein
MASAYSNFDRIIGARLQQFSPEAIRQRHIGLARRGRALYQAEHPDKTQVTIEVDGQTAANEAAVRPFGTIAYLIRSPVLAEAARFAKTVAREISPVVSGRYREGWMILADRVEVEAADIPPQAKELIVVDDVPYASKIEIFGARLVGVPPGIVERVREHVLQRYGNQIVATVDYIHLPGGYVLKRAPGGEMTYPALVMRARQ